MNARTRDIDDVPESELQVHISAWVNQLADDMPLRDLLCFACLELPVRLTQMFVMGRVSPMQLIVQASVVRTHTRWRWTGFGSCGGAHGTPNRGWMFVLCRYWNECCATRG